MEKVLPAREHRGDYDVAFTGNVAGNAPATTTEADTVWSMSRMAARRASWAALNASRVTVVGSLRKVVMIAAF